MDKVCVLDTIISLVEGIKRKKNKEDKYVTDQYNGQYCTLSGLDYLLGQVIRQYEIPFENYYISEKAKALWAEISDDNIRNYWYTNIVLPIRDSREVHGRYVGAKKEPEEKCNIKKGVKFRYRSIFHDEHILPVCQIRKELTNLDALTYDNILSILNKICICKMLKSENVSLGNNHNRPNTVEGVLNVLYAKKGVKTTKL